MHAIRKHLNDYANTRIQLRCLRGPTTRSRPPQISFSDSAKALSFNTEPKVFTQAFCAWPVAKSAALLESLDHDA